MDVAGVRTELARVELPEGWGLCSFAEGQALAAQLQKELRSGHALHERECIALAKHGACDDVLFFVESEASYAAILALVHLTWHVPRVSGDFPWAEQFTSVDDWLARSPVSRPRA